MSLLGRTSGLSSISITYSTSHPLESERLADLDRNSTARRFFSFYFQKKKEKFCFVFVFPTLK